MTSQVIRKINQKSEAERSANTKLYLIYIHYLVILILSFGFTIIFVKNNLKNCELNHDEIVKIANEIFDEKYRKNQVNKNNFDRKSFTYLDENQENDIKRIKREILQDENKEPPIVEFFHPNLKNELEKNDTEILKKTGWKGSAPGGDSWVWMTAYSRIPFEAIEGFCKKTREYCPPGPTGLPGRQGAPGLKGERGIVGPPGRDGFRGLTGPKGIKGDIGRPGNDGRNGIPGEPGVDGMPGRMGIDGTKGEKGDRGDRGSRGQHGKDGINGVNGTPGTKGEKGERGLEGPQGLRGFPGINGLNGAPATCVYTSDTHLNDTGKDGIDFYMPPQIPVAASQTYKIKPIIVREKDNVRLQCKATGLPEPTIVWTREDNKLFDEINWRETTKVGPLLNISQINRRHMGTYICVADNGISPSAKHKYAVEVHFIPMVEIPHARNQNVTVSSGSSVTFDCLSQAFPPPVIYWERVDNGQATIIHNDRSKYRIEMHTMGTYEFNSSLTINNIDDGDTTKKHVKYYCVSKNIMGSRRIQFNILSEKSSIRDGDNSITEGDKYDHPKYEPTDQCVQIPCPECKTPKDMKCKDTSLSLTDLTGGKELEIMILDGKNYTDLGDRKQSCELSMIGKPILNHYLDIPRGAWMRDPVTRDNVTVEKIWLSKESDQEHLFEYRNRFDYQKNIPSRSAPYKLVCPFKGSANIIYNGYFYYYCEKVNRIYRFDLRSEVQVSYDMEKVESFNKTHLLYEEKLHVIDFNADDNGIWIIHSAKNSNNTIVSKINETTLEPLVTFDLSLQHPKIGEMFIICGVLYAVDSSSKRDTKIRFALDLYTGNRLLDKEIDFTNPLNGTSTIAYNHNTKELYTWNSGNQLTYPVKINAMGTNATSDDFPEMETLIANTVARSVIAIEEKSAKNKMKT